MVVLFLPMMSVFQSTVDSLPSPVAQGAPVGGFYALDGPLATTEQRVPPNTSSHAGLCLADSLRVSADQLI